MGLNKKEGDMYEFVTHTWSTIKGACEHDCSNCYMKRRGGQRPVHFDKSELRTDLGAGNFIFVGSSNDLFCDSYPAIWIFDTLDYCNQYDNIYLFQTKFPEQLLHFIDHPVFLKKSIVCTTLESDFCYPDVMGHAPFPFDRSIAMSEISDWGVPTQVTIEPIMQFRIETFVEEIKRYHPTQVVIGADTGNHHLPEPSGDDIRRLIDALQHFTKVLLKPNLNRLLKP
jgi:DNA repair photolyase